MASVSEQVNGVFENLTRSVQTAESPLASGWETHLPSGEKVVRSQLEDAAHPLIKLGADAVPDLLRWAANDNPALRYVAVYALQQITDLRPFVLHFDQEDKEGHRSRAIEEWRRWHQQRTNR